MRSAKFFVFQCYSGNVLLFTSYGRHGRNRIPIPLSDPEFKNIQNESIATGLKLSYCYLSAGLEKATAMSQLQQLIELAAKTELTASASKSPDESNAIQIHWLPTCGSRLFPARANH